MYVSIYIVYYPSQHQTISTFLPIRNSQGEYKWYKFEDSEVCEIDLSDAELRHRCFGGFNEENKINGYVDSLSNNKYVKNTRIYNVLLIYSLYLYNQIEVLKLTKFKIIT